MNQEAPLFTLPEGWTADAMLNAIIAEGEEALEGKRPWQNFVVRAQKWANFIKSVQPRAVEGVEGLRELLLELEWRGHASSAQEKECFEQSGSFVTDHFFCPMCRAHDEDSDKIPHTPKCKLALAIASLRASQAVVSKEDK